MRVLSVYDFVIHIAELELFLKSLNYKQETVYFLYNTGIEERQRQKSTKALFNKLILNSS